MSKHPHMIHLPKDYKPYKAKQRPRDIYGVPHENIVEMVESHRNYETPALRKGRRKRTGTVGRQGYTYDEVVETLGMAYRTIQRLMTEQSYELARNTIMELDDDWIEGYRKFQTLKADLEEKFIKIYDHMAENKRVKYFCDKHGLNDKYYKYMRSKCKVTTEIRNEKFGKLVAFLEAYKNSHLNNKEAA